jgi:prolyl oligopeptidase
VTEKAAPPPARREDVVDTLFGVRLPDPYRWMEADGTDLTEWLAQQNQWARSELASLPGSKTYRARIQQLRSFTGDVEAVKRRGARLFYLARQPGSERRTLHVLDARGHRMLWDQAGEGISIDFFQPSWDGRWVAVGTSEADSEDSAIRVIDSTTGKLLPEVLAHTKLALVSWLAGKDAFLYWRQPEQTVGSAPADLYKNGRIYLHHLGTSPAQDRAVFGPGVSRGRLFEDAEMPFTITDPSLPDLVFGAATRGAAWEITVNVAPSAAVLRGDPTWRALVAYEDLAVQVRPYRGYVYLLTSAGAPLRRIVRRCVWQGCREPDAEIIPEQSDPIVDFDISQDGIVVRSMVRGAHRLRVYTLEGTPRGEVPVNGSVSAFTADSNESGVWFVSQNWTTPAQVLFHQPGMDVPDDLDILDVSRTGLPGLQVVRLEVPARDGVLIPVTLVHARDVKWPAPLILTAYGAFGYTYPVRFDPYRVAWFERGGAFAVAHVRGGGELGDAWHRAGQKTRKETSVTDYLACAEALIAKRHTSRDQLLGWGRSAGGLLVGAAVTRQPELFSAAILSVPVVNPLRFENTPGGFANAMEFGSVKNENEFAALRKVDAYHLASRSAAYPPTLVTCGIRDSRVPCWQAAKLVAQLQHATRSRHPVLLRVEYEGGHGFGASQSQLEREWSDFYAFAERYTTTPASR